MDAVLSLRSAALMAGAQPLADHAELIRGALSIPGSPAWEVTRRLLAALTISGTERCRRSPVLSRVRHNATNTGADSHARAQAGFGRIGKTPRTPRLRNYRPQRSSTDAVQRQNLRIGHRIPTARDGFPVQRATGGVTR
jgi:hypothetical protein